MYSNGRKIKVVEVPQINTIKQYDNFHRVDTGVYNPSKKYKKIVTKKRKIRVIGVDIMKIRSVFLYAIILFGASIVQMKISYDISDLGRKDKELKEKIDVKRIEVEELRNNYFSKYDLKQLGEKSRELGFIDDDSINYIKLD